MAISLFSLSLFYSLFGMGGGGGDPLLKIMENVWGIELSKEKKKKKKKLNNKLKFFFFLPFFFFFFGGGGGGVITDSTRHGTCMRY